MNNNKKWVVYLVRCSDNSLYCGISNDLKKRLLEHNSGKGAKYTRSRRPIKLVGVSSEITKSEALKLEYRIKQLPADRKIAELTRKEAERTVEQDLKALEKSFKTLCKKVEKLTKAVEKAVNTQDYS
jgi:putative endonuclease